MTVTYLITGTNKGIGLALVEIISKEDDVKVIATVRRPSEATELQELAAKTKNIEIVELHPSSDESIDKFAKVLETVAADGIDYFIGNAAFAKLGLFDEMPYDGFVDTFKTNVFGNVFLVRAALPFLRKKPTKKIVFISSLAGSMSGFMPMPSAAYGASKAALNYFAKSIDFSLGSEGFTVISVHPGLVSTKTALDAVDAMKDITAALPWVTPEDSATGIINLAKTSTREVSGKFLDTDGSELPY